MTSYGIGITLIPCSTIVLIISKIVSESCLAYKAENGTCLPQCDDGSSISSTQTYSSTSCYRLSTVLDIQRDIIANGPVQTGMNIYNDFSNYENGIYIYDKISTLKGGHSVRIIGWGIEGNVPYWICANQWGSEWGENGYFRIRRGTNEVGIEESVVGGIPKFAGMIPENENYQAGDISNSSMQKLNVRLIVMLLVSIYLP
jgi:hypothetical protein